MELMIERRGFSDDGVSPKTFPRQKPHRKVLSGLKLLNNTVTPNTTVTASVTVTATASERWGKRRVHFWDEEAIPNPEIEDEDRDLPHDVVAFQILTRLPIKSLVQLKSVSKEWYSTISSSAFASAQLRECLCSHVESLFIHADNNYYLLFYQEQEENSLVDYSLVQLEIDFVDQQHKNEMQLLGSCNGVVCLAYSSPVLSYFYLWNPITRLSCKFPDPNLLCSNSTASWGFAYVPSQDDYKVVRLIQDHTALQLIVHVFSLRAHKWKRVHHHGLDHSLSLTKSNPGVLVDETLYWFMDTRSGPARNPMVVGFNLAHERFEKKLELVPRSVTPWNQCLYDIGGCLSLYGSSTQEKEEEVYVSILKTEGQVETINLSPELSPRVCSGLVGLTRAGRLFIVSKKWELALIDPNVVPTQYTPLIAFKKDCRPSVIRYVPSLVSGFFKNRAEGLLRTQNITDS